MGSGVSAGVVKYVLKESSEEELKNIGKDLTPELAAKIKAALEAPAADSAPEIARGFPVEDLEELCDGDGCSIEKTEERAITVHQLKRVLAYVQAHCTKEGWQSTNPANLGPLNPDKVNLYDLATLLIKPVTEAKKCAYVELVAIRVQVPKWFVSHWWGEPVNDFVICISQQALDRALGDTTEYWVCAYANNQWNLAGDVSDDPANSSFRKAIDLAVGTVTILDRGAVTFSRVWCAYEIYVSLQAEVEERHYSYDVYTMYTDADAVGITDGFVEADKWRGKKQLWSHQFINRKAEREMNFPSQLAPNTLATEVQKAQSSFDSDRIHILNAIICSKDLNATVPDEHQNFEALNRLLRGRFAAGLYRVAVASGQYIDLVAAALRDSELSSVCLGLDGMESLDFARVAQDLPPLVNVLDLSLAETGMTAAGCEAFSAGLPHSNLKSLKLVLDKNNFGDEGMVVVGKLASKAEVEFLDLRLNSVGKTDAGVESLSLSLCSMSGLGTLCLHMQDDKIGIKAAEALGQGFMQMKAMRSLSVNVDRTNMDDEAFTALCAGFGKLEHITSLSVWARKNCLSSAAVEPLITACQNLKLDGLTIEVQGNNLDKDGKDKLAQLKLESVGKSRWKIVC